MEKPEEALAHTGLRLQEQLVKTEGGRAGLPSVLSQVGKQVSQMGALAGRKGWGQTHFFR